MRILSVVFLGVCASLISACVSQPGIGDAPDVYPMACEASSAQSAIGQRYSEPLAEQLRESTFAREVRRLGPDTMTTMEFQSDRLNVVVDRRDVITEIRCG